MHEYARIDHAHLAVVTLPRGYGCGPTPTCASSASSSSPAARVQSAVA